METGTSDGRRRLFAVVAVLVLAVATFGAAAAVESEDTEAATSATGTATVGTSYSKSFSLSYSTDYQDDKYQNTSDWDCGVYSSSSSVTVSPSSSNGLSAEISASMSSPSTLNCTIKVSGTPTSSGTVTFTGTVHWYIQNLQMEEEYDFYQTFTVTITISQTYYAYLYYDANGGSGAPSTQSASSTSSSGSKSFTVSSTTPTRSGYTFLGWSTSSSATSASYQAGDKISVSYGSSKTLYAVWEKTSYTATLKYDANGGSGAPSAQTYTGTSTSSHTFTISSTVPTRDGYGFLGWATSSSATSASYQPGGTISVGYNSTVTLYAVWQAVYTCTLEYDANGGSGAPEAQTYTSSSTSDHEFTVSTAVPVLEGCDFLGWATSSSATDADYQPGDSIAVACDGTVTLYAVWSVQEFTVTFRSDGQIYAQLTLAYNSTATPPDDPELSGMFFTGWYSDEGCTMTYDFLSPVTADLDLYASWVEELAFVTVPTIDVTITWNDGTLSADASASTDWQRIAWYVDGCLACYGECVTLSLPAGTHHVTAVATNSAGAALWGDYVEVPDDDDGDAGIPWIAVAAVVLALLILIVALRRRLLVAGAIAVILAAVAFWYLL